MARAQLIQQFTINQEIDHWCDGDDVVGISGYVDNIEGIRMISSARGNQANVPLLKIIINNGQSRRVRVLFWGAMATEYAAKIQDRTMIKITHAKSSHLNRRFCNPADNVVPIELSVNSSSVIEIMHNLFPEERPIEVVAINNAPNHRNIMYVFGWLKFPFVRVNSFNSNYGNGVIVNGDYRIRVRVAEYEPNPVLIEGVYVQVRCECFIDDRGIPFLLARSMADVIVDPDSNVLTPMELRVRGFLTPIRVAEDNEI